MTSDPRQTLASGLVPGVLLGTGGAVLVGLLSDTPDQVALFFVVAGSVAFVLGGLAHRSAGSLEGSLGDYTAGDFSVEDARRSALRLVGLGVGLALGGGLALVAL